MVDHRELKVQKVKPLLRKDYGYFTQSRSETEE
jgi:hypothetical protein